MPELPEVEVTRRGISPHITGQRVERVDVRTPALRWPIPQGLTALLAGRRVERVERRGKYLLIEFDVGWLIMHLGMSGTLRILPRAALERQPEKTRSRRCGVRRMRRAAARPAALWRRALACARDGATCPNIRCSLRSASSHSRRPSPRNCCSIVRAGARCPSSRPCSRATSWSASAISTRRRACFARAFIRRARRDASRSPATKNSPRRFAIRSPRRSPRAAVPCATSSRATARAAISSSTTSSTIGRASRAGSAATPVRQIVQGQRSTFYCPTCQR